MVSCPMNGPVPRRMQLGMDLGPGSTHPRQEQASAHSRSQGRRISPCILRTQWTPHKERRKLHDPSRPPPHATRSRIPRSNYVGDVEDAKLRPRG